MFKRITLKKFSNEIALDMGMKVIEMAKSRGLEIAIEIK